MKHNKKRNTAFLYEILLREGTKATLTKDEERLANIKSILLHYFSPISILSEELKLYSALRVPSVDKSLSERFLAEVKNRYMCLDKRQLFNEQTKLISTINKVLGADSYNNFIPYYKDLATIAQIFNDSTPIKEKILLEQEILKQIVISESVEDKQLKPIDNLVFKKFVSKFNQKYSGLLTEQKSLLTKYVNSFADEGIELKVYLNEEIGRLKEKIDSALKKEEIKEDERMFNKTNKLNEVLNKFKSDNNISNEMLENILKIQQFVHEVEN